MEMGRVSIDVCAEQVAELRRREGALNAKRGSPRGFNALVLWGGQVAWPGVLPWASHRIILIAHPHLRL